MKNLIILTIGLMMSTTAFAELGEDTTRRENSIVKELPKNEFYYGFGAGIDQTNGFNNISGNILFKTKKMKIYGLNVGISNQLGEYKPFVGGSMYWKLGKK